MKNKTRDATTEKKLLQIVNLSPSEEWMERIVEIHPMRQIFWATIVQVSVFGFMMLAFSTINFYLEMKV
jgi:hypothetical protein|tara:strand:- start:53 stop:259 length:207 start_codon:yes stop_codon:yes gene_type:complete